MPSECLPHGIPAADTRTGPRAGTMRQDEPPCACSSPPPSWRRWRRSEGWPTPPPGLTAELRDAGVDVDVVLPDYAPERDRTPLAGEVSQRLDVPAWAGPASVRVGDHPTAGRVHLVSVPRMARSHPYLSPDGSGWPDNAARFLAFSRAVAAMVRRGPPDVLHLNDWHTGAVLAALPKPPPSVLTVHNVAYQGVTDGGWLRRLGPRSRHYEWWGGTNPLSGAIALADAVVTVSPNHAKRDPHAGRRLRARRTAACSGCGRVRHPQWHRHGAVGPGDRRSPRHDVLECRSRHGAGGEGDEPRRAADEVWMARRRHAAGRDGDSADRAEGRRPDPADRAGASAPPAAPDRARRRRGAARQRPRRPGGRPPPRVRLRRGLRRATGPPDVRRRRPVRDAEPVRAVWPDPDAGDALRHDPRRHRRRRTGRHRARRRCVTRRQRVRRRQRGCRRARVGAVPGRRGCSPTGVGARRWCGASWGATGRGATRPPSTSSTTRRSCVEAEAAARRRVAPLPTIHADIGTPPTGRATRFRRDGC